MIMPSPAEMYRLRAINRFGLPAQCLADNVMSVPSFTVLMRSNRGLSLNYLATKSARVCSRTKVA
jgi:hypothetical protein